MRSTPYGATNTRAVTVHTSDSRCAVVALPQTTAPASRAAVRIARRKNGALVRWCHSGWSKNVQSCTVTTTGVFVRSGMV